MSGSRYVVVFIVLGELRFESTNGIYYRMADLIKFGTPHYSSQEARMWSCRAFWDENANLVLADDAVVMTVEEAYEVEKMGEM